MVLINSPRHVHINQLSSCILQEKRVFGKFYKLVKHHCFSYNKDDDQFKNKWQK